jgi:hypothetical protein
VTASELTAVEHAAIRHGFRGQEQRLREALTLTEPSFFFAVVCRHGKGEILWDEDAVASHSDRVTEAPNSCNTMIKKHIE